MCVRGGEGVVLLTNICLEDDFLADVRTEFSSPASELLESVNMDIRINLYLQINNILSTEW